jgi:hypothetical protein
LDYHVSGIPETWKSVIKVGQRLLEEALGKMKTEGKPTGAAIRSGVELPIGIELRSQRF